MDAQAATTPTKSTIQFKAETDGTVSPLSVAVESAASTAGSSWVLRFMESPAGLAAFEDELLLKTGKPTVDILAECVKDTLQAVQHQKSNDKGAVEFNMDKFVENSTTFVEKYNASKGSLEEEADVCGN